MRIGVLEWASCGGAVGAAGLPESIRQEGWAMCRALIESLQRAGHEPVSCLLPDLPCVTASMPSLRHIQVHGDVRSQWRDAYSTCDATIVVAPETDGVLLDVERWCRAAGIRSCSSDAQFIEYAGDKWQTSQFWHRSGVPNPPTQLLSKWRPEATEPHRWDKWAVKLRDGAGCEGMKCLSTDEVERLQLHHSSGERWVVQPWLNGAAHSRSAIADASGRFHWMPVVSQCLGIDGHITYRGGCVQPDLNLPPECIDDLERAIRSLPGKPRGWIGVDFLLSDTGQLTVIEINPRLTTSFVGLSRACHVSLAESIVKAVLGLEIDLPKDWKAIQFTSTC